MADDEWDNVGSGFGDDRRSTTSALGNEDDAEGSVDAIDWGDMLRYKSVKDATKLLRSSRMLQMIQRLSEYSDAEPKNAIPKDDPEYAFIGECSELVLHIEVEKSKVFKFVRDHYEVHFPELRLFIQDGITYCKLVKALQNDLTSLDAAVDAMDDIIPSQLSAVIIAAASTSQGRELDAAEWAAVVGGADEMNALELAKQTLLEYIQQRMPLVCPNLCAFLGTGIVSQIFAITSSVTKIATMDPADLATLGSHRGTAAGGIPVKTTGFLMNADLVACHPPQLRPKALRLVASAAVTLARIDDNRRAGDNYQGLKQREDVKRKMIMWTDPVGLRGAANNTYERRTRKRNRDDTRNASGGVGSGSGSFNR